MELEYTPNEKQQNVVNMVKSFWRNGKKAKAPRTSVVDKCYRYYNNEHFTEAQKLAKEGPKSTRNYIFSSVEDAVALMTDSMPVADAWPRTNSPEDAIAAQKGKQGLDWVWERTDMEVKLPMAIRDSLIAGCGWLKVDYDHLRDYPYGEVSVDVVLFDYICLDPDATNEDTARYIIQATPTPLWLIKKMYPKMGKYVKADDSISEDKEDSTDIAVTVSAETTHETEGKGAIEDVPHKRAWLIECWLRDDTVIYEEELDENGETKRSETPKYPKGRRIVIAGDVWLNEGEDENPFEDGRFPYVMIPNYEATGKAYPKGDVEYLIEINNDINLIVSRMKDWVKNTAHTYLVYDDKANIDKNSLEPLEAALIPIGDGGKFEVHSPPALASGLFEFLDTCKSDLEIICALREVTQGRDPKSGKSGVAFEKLQEYAMSRLRKKGRNIDNAVKKISELFLSRIRQFYTEERQIRITGDTPIYAEAKPQIDPLTGQPMMDLTTGQPVMGEPEVQRYQPYSFGTISRADFVRQTPSVDEMGNPVVNENGPMMEEEPIQLDVVIQSGVAAAATRMQEREEAIILLKEGVIDAEEVARRYGIKNYKEIQARILQQKQMEAQMIAAQGGGLVGGQTG